LALALDMLIQIVLLVAIAWGLIYAASHARTPVQHSVSESTVSSIAIAIVVTILFVVFFGYFIAFEALWSGQTPGKKVLGIRVVRDGGFPIDPTSSLIRNLVRIGEVALGFYAVSAIAALLSAENKRLGDSAAGTIVVRDARVQSLARIVEAHDGQERRIATITDDEHALIARYVARRASMAPQYRRQLASRIAERVRKRVSSDLQRLDDDDLLERLNG
jgi:uncharacterized RDD family membrane protein YckC